MVYSKKSVITSANLGNFFELRNTILLFVSKTPDSINI